MVDERFRCPVHTTLGFDRSSRYLDWPTWRREQDYFACESSNLVPRSTNTAVGSIQEATSGTYVPKKLLMCFRLTADATRNHVTLHNQRPAAPP